MNLSVCRYSALVAILLVSVAGCTWNVSPNVTDDGHVNVSDLVFPEQNVAWQKDGKIINQNDIAKIKAGVNKDELYQLIGPPHFSEGHKAREWDYIFKFYDKNQKVETCQYKVIFDKNYKGQEFYWQPASCAKYAR